MFTRARSFLAIASVLIFAGIVSAQDLPNPVRWKHSTASLTILHETGVSIDASGGNRTVTLPSAYVAGRHIIVRKYDSSANTVTVTPGAGDTINLAATVVLTTQGQTVELYSTGRHDWTDASNTFGLVTTAGALAPASAAIGGGYGSTGVTISAAGAISANGALIVDGASTLTGAVAANGGLSVDSPAFVVANTSGNVSTTGTLAVTGASSLGSDVTVTRTLGLTPATSTGAISGLPKIKMAALGTATNGAAAGKTSKIDLDDDTPAGEWTAVDGDTVSSNSTTYTRVGTNSLKIAIAATADATDGVTNTLGSGDQDWTDDASVGFWVYSTKALDAGDLVFTIVDDGVTTPYNVPAAAVNTWTWATIDISALANASKDVIQSVSLTLSAAGEAKALAGAFDVYIDQMFKWDDTEVEALSTAILPDGVLSVMAIATAAATANTPTILTEGTDFFVLYASGNDSLVWITDQSAASTVALVAY